MFIGHYGIAYIVKKKEEKIPLWMLFTSVQLLDLIAFTLVLLGIENASYQQSENPFFRNMLYLPYSHSLIGALLVSLLVFAIFWIKNKKKWAWILSLCVLSHWFIDLIVHTKDLPILFGSLNVGLGLWNYPLSSFAIEMLLVILGWSFWGNKNFVSYILLMLMIISFTGMICSDEPEIMKTNDYLRTSVVLISNGIFIFLAYLTEFSLKKARKIHIKE